MNTARPIAPWTSRIALGVSVAAVLTACDGEAVGVAAPARVVGLAVLPAPQPLARWVTIALDRPAAVEVTYGAEGTSPLRVTAEAEDHLHTILLPRLRSERSYDFQVRPLPGGDPAAGSFETTPLPESLAGLSFRTEGRPTHPLVALDVQHTVGFGGVAIVDRGGEIVWYQEVPGGVLGVTQRANGNFALISRSFGVREYTPAGELVASLPNTESRMAHHDLVEHEGRLLVLTTDPRPWNGALVGGDAVWSWDTETDALERVWSSWDHLDPAVDWGELSRPGDWLHANSLTIGPRGNLVISLRSLDQVISIDVARNAVEWRFGGVNATIPVPPAEEFRGQHTAAEIAPNRVLLFDNGWDRTEDPFSRAVIFDLDPAGGRAVKSREFRPVPDNWSRALSLARQLPGGNLFVHFGGTGGPIESYEVGPGGDVLWKMLVEGIPSLYRAWPLVSIAGEEAL